MIRRLYIHNYRCLENFELPIRGHSSVLLIGKNGAGKTTVGAALQILQKIARGTNRIKELVKPGDLTRNRTEIPMRFEIEVELDAGIYEYVIAFELPDDFKELRVHEERLTVAGELVYSRNLAQVLLASTNRQKNAEFNIDWHLVALPIVQERSTKDPLYIFKRWLGRMLILRPIPSLIHGESEQETLYPEPGVENFAAWFSGLIQSDPANYAEIVDDLRQAMPDFQGIKNLATGGNSRSLIVQFSNQQGNLTLPFEHLSDGEKCFLIAALTLAANKQENGLFCFWDEPDNYLAMDEVGHFVMALRQAFQTGGQFVATSHNTEAIRRFSQENTLLLYRKSHLEPTIVRPLSELHISGDLVNALIRGDVEP
ncbi:MAG: AAA family ATPase [Blastocatellia bacterium]|nr:AAA family ATPase [Blastocatellia bacterium]